MGNFICLYIHPIKSAISANSPYGNWEKGEGASLVHQLQNRYPLLGMIQVHTKIHTITVWILGPSLWISVIVQDANHHREHPCVQQTSMSYLLCAAALLDPEIQKWKIWSLLSSMKCQSTWGNTDQMSNCESKSKLQKESRPQRKKYEKWVL
jgi:hypothetical protein